VTFNSSSIYNATIAISFNKFKLVLMRHSLKGRKFSFLKQNRYIDYSIIILILLESKEIDL
ncbi:MAG: hypothetical protein ACW964_09105, partial [Candidatus Hodarchaeales archaeon]